MLQDFFNQRFERFPEGPNFSSLAMAKQKNPRKAVVAWPSMLRALCESRVDPERVLCKAGKGMDGWFCWKTCYICYMYTGKKRITAFTTRSNNESVWKTMFFWGSGDFCRFHVNLWECTVMIPLRTFPHSEGTNLFFCWTIHPYHTPEV